MTPYLPPRLLTEREVLTHCALQERHIPRLLELGDFPEPVSTAIGCVAWRESDISQWIESRPQALPAVDAEFREVADDDA
jgi:predicted DNA-binding transcriptional regulator AlpA